MILPVVLVAGLALAPAPAPPSAKPPSSGFSTPRGDTLVVVGPGGDVATLAAGIARAAPGGRIVVRPGTYREPTIVVDRPVRIEGEPGAVLDGEGERTILVVTADDVSISGLELRRVGVSYVDDLAAIEVKGARRCRIEDNRIDDAFFGIYLAETDGCVVRHNVITGGAVRESRAGNGIHAWYSRGLEVAQNRIVGHRDGIYFEFVEDSRVAGNRSEGNLRYGLHFMFSDRCRYEDNEFLRNGAGVAVMYASHVVMRGNTFAESRGSASFGLLLKDITDSEIAGNVFRGNTVGIHAEGFDRTRVDGNDFVENGRAVRILANSQDSEFTQNNFIDNTFDVTTNSRRVYSTFRANHWDAYRGYDLEDDGTGDVEHRPVRLFALIVERTPEVTILLRGFLPTLLDWTERLVPSLTPENLVDPAPAMRPFPREAA
ncbi:MAG: nitrous oxide reductase family maturation protein NosD [Gemmatimonadota bacterium]|nr:nitrous oxide reductase family maturation protein NosD [Gemmatimonadota bacterium]